jgi:hypothetical protein
VVPTLIVDVPAVMLNNVPRRGGDRRMKSSTHKFLWWVSHRQEAFLNFVLMGLVSLPIIVWAILFLLVVSMGHGQALMRLAVPPLRQMFQ